MRGKAAAIAERRPVLSSVSVACHPFAGQVSGVTHPVGWAIITLSVALNRSKCFDQSASIKLTGERLLGQELLSAHLCRRKETNFNIVGCVNHFSIDGDSSVGDRHDELSFDQSFDIDLIGY